MNSVVRVDGVVPFAQNQTLSLALQALTADSFGGVDSSSWSAHARAAGGTIVWA